jgi:DNA-binding IclR family transcriptional regulator
MAPASAIQNTVTNNSEEQLTPTYPIGSVDSALRLLVLIAERPQVRIAEASNALEVARSTAHRLMQMLQYHGFVRQLEDSKAYTAGPRLVNLGLAVVNNIDIRKLARPVLEELRNELDETVHLLELRGSELICLDSIESQHALRIGTRTGMVLPAFASAGGRVILAQLSRRELRAIYPSARLGKLQERTVRTRAELEAELERVRDQGYAIQHEETEVGVTGVAAAIPRAAGVSQHAITVAIPTSRFPTTDAARVAAAVRAYAARIGDDIPD